jgi:hypothetical protein
MPTTTRSPSMPEYKVWTLNQLHDEAAYLRYRTTLLETEIARRQTYSNQTQASDEHATWPGAA